MAAAPKPQAKHAEWSTIECIEMVASSWLAHCLVCTVGLRVIRLGFKNRRSPCPGLFRFASLFALSVIGLAKP